MSCWKNVCWDMYCQDNAISGKIACRYNIHWVMCYVSKMFIWEYTVSCQAIIVGQRVYQKKGYSEIVV